MLTGPGLGSLPFNPSCWEADAGGLRIQGQLGLHRKIPCPNEQKVILLFCFERGLIFKVDWEEGDI